MAILNKDKKNKIKQWLNNKYPINDIDKIKKYEGLRRNSYRKYGKKPEIKIEEIIWNSNCPISEMSLDYKSTKRFENTATFDRIDNAKGYIKNNVAVISNRANRIKNDGTIEEHERIVEYMKKKKLNCGKRKKGIKKIINKSQNGAGIYYLPYYDFFYEIQ